ncbi:MAG TPA: alpha/beta hydrolase-fold protein [Gemmatimonadaceae bacterium]|nr:alpha/beta hydrolase-fold protein [Gemmatimonadaceae bacterium]
MLRPRSRRLGALRWRAGALLCAGVLAACDPVPTEQVPEPTPSNGRLTARVVAPTLTVPLGLTVQTITEGGRPFGLYVPSNYTADTNWPVTVLLHGSGASGEGMALDFKDYAEATGLVVLAPNSYSITWDLIAFGQFSVDRTYIDNMLKWAFDHIAADSQRVSISGFSDGAIYAIWLGLKNGDLFSRLGAFTPCLNVPNIRTGTPEIFMSHGIDDQERPIDACSREIAPVLVNAGYTVQYVEYPSPLGNGHYITPEVITQGMTFLAKPVGQ